VSPSPERLAAIDVGSNTILLLIADYQPSLGLTVIEEAEEQPRLGAGLLATGRLSNASMERALQSLTRMRERCRQRGVARVDAVATAAVREAANGQELVDRVQSLGIHLRIISPETEAALAYRSAAYHFPGAERTLVADIGGGSLELVGAAEGQIRLIRSLPVGAVRLTELQLPLPALREHIRQLLADAAVDRSWAGSKVVGSGGTFSTLASMVLAQRGLPPLPIHGTEVSVREAELLLSRLSAMDGETRRSVPGLRPERADIIVAGLAVAAELLQSVASAAVTLSGYGVREGLLLEMAELPEKIQRHHSP
jgi:exopolyphosphatase/guanosine-5'-triphosphate,3'-diphosphate pyrophosphatase